MLQEDVARSLTPRERRGPVARRYNGGDRVDDWETVADDRGRTYYWNRRTGESSWSLPEEDDRLAEQPMSPVAEAPVDEDVVSIDEFGRVRLDRAGSRTGSRSNSFRRESMSRGSSAASFSSSNASIASG